MHYTIAPAQLGTPLLKLADMAGLGPREKYQLQRRFDLLSGTLREKGVEAGTAHKRLIIPKAKLTETDMAHLGFTPVKIAIPEAGQDRFTSWRHPDNLFHIHSHPEGWTMHEDEHAASTMLARKAKGIKNKAKAHISGVPHVSEEGLPGLFYYVKGRLKGHKSTAQQVLAELDVDTLNKIKRLKNRPGISPELADAARNLQSTMKVTVPEDQVAKWRERYPGATIISDTQDRMQKAAAAADVAGDFMSSTFPIHMGTGMITDAIHGAVARKIINTLDPVEVEGATTEKMMKSLGLPEDKFVIRDIKDWIDAQDQEGMIAPPEREEVEEGKEYEYSMTGPGWVFGEDKPVILGPTQGPGTEIMAHELGHQATLQTLPGKVLGKARMVLGIGGGIGEMVAAHQGRAILAPTLALAKEAPTLIDEALASRHAMKALRDVGASDDEIVQAKRNLQKAYATYASGAALGTLPALATAVARKYIK